MSKAKDAVTALILAGIVALCTAPLWLPWVVK